MTEESRKQNVTLALSKAERDLENARKIRQGEGYDAAVSLAYYSAYHHARALLLMEGLEPKTHSGLIRLIHLHFVRTGRLEPETATSLSVLEAQRELAAYEAAAVFTCGQADKAIGQAEEFAAAARDLLRQAGY